MKLSIISKLAIIFMFNLGLGALLGQTTAVSATIIDNTSQVWANGSYTVTFQPSPNQPSAPYYLNGTLITAAQKTYTGTLSGSGVMAVTLLDNSQITPYGSSWNFSICSNTSAPCSTIGSLAVSGASLNLSTTLSNGVSLPVVQATPIPRAYGDTEVNVNATQVGYLYQNVTTNAPRYWNGSYWSYFGGTVNSVTLSNLGGFFTTANIGNTSNYQFIFTPVSAAPYTVWSNPSSNTAIPAYNLLTQAMMPNPLAANTANTAVTASNLASTTQCGSSPQYFATGLNTNGTANCSQVSFGVLANRWSTSQVYNSGSGTSYLNGAGSYTVPAYTPPTTTYLVQQVSKSSGLCTTSGASDGTCSSPVSMTWATAFADTSYAVTCSSGALSSGVSLTAFYTTSLTTSGFTLNYQNGTADAAVATLPSVVYCIGVHN